MKFSVIQGDFTTPFFKQIPDNVRYKAICNDLDEGLIISDLKNTKVNKKNYVEGEVFVYCIIFQLH